MTEIIPPVWELTPRDSRYYRARIRYRKERGLCIHCGIRPSVKGKVKCPQCAAQTAMYQSMPKHRRRHSEYVNEVTAYRKHEGLCIRCGRNLTMFDKYGTYTCADCRNKINKHSRESRRALWERRKKRGLCPRCGERPMDGGYKTCSVCRAKVAAAAYKYSHRRKAHRDRQVMTLAS